MYLELGCLSVRVFLQFWCFQSLVGLRVRVYLELGCFWSQGVFIIRVYIEIGCFDIQCHKKMRNFEILECCEFFKIAFAKILDFLRRLKIRSKALTRYQKWLRESKLLLEAIFFYPILNLADTLPKHPLPSSDMYRPLLPNCSVQILEITLI